MNTKSFGVSKKPLVYLAAPLFSQAEKSFNEQLACHLGKYFAIYMPQRDGGLMVELIPRGQTVDDAARQVFAMDIRALNAASAVIAVLDGRTIDEGVALELGYAYALHKPCYGYQTDPRRLLPVGNNPMISGVLIRVAHSLDELLLFSESLVQELSMHSMTHSAK